MIYGELEIYRYVFWLSYFNFEFREVNIYYQYFSLLFLWKQQCFLCMSIMLITFWCRIVFFGGLNDDKLKIKVSS